MHITIPDQEEPLSDSGKKYGDTLKIAKDVQLYPVEGLEDCAQAIRIVVLLHGS
jgi:hypothetical protein